MSLSFNLLFFFFSLYSRFLQHFLNSSELSPIFSSLLYIFFSTSLVLEQHTRSQLKFEQNLKLSSNFTSFFYTALQPHNPEILFKMTIPFFIFEGSNYDWTARSIPRLFRLGCVQERTNARLLQSTPTYVRSKATQLLDWKCEAIFTAE